MKKLLLSLLALVALVAADVDIIAGQKTLRSNLVTYSAASGNWSNKTRILFLGNNVYVDTSTTGQAGQWKRIDNTADSCSNPIPLTSDSTGTARPIWEYRLWETVRSVDKDSSAHVYRVNTREWVYDATAPRGFRWTPWTRTGSNAGYLDVTVQDSLLVSNAGTTAKISQYALAMFAGSWARLCPDDVAATANAAADSVFADSSRVYTR